MNRATRDPYAGDAEELRERLRALTDEVQRNELLLRKTQAREVELLRAPTLGELFDRIVTGLRDAYGLDVVTLSLFDPQHELRHLSGNETLSSTVIDEVRFVDAVSPLAPRLDALLFNGGATPTHALLADSPALDAGSDALALAPDGSPLLLDQRGEDRISGAAVDIGAFEAFVLPPNLPPADIQLSAASLDENQPAGTAIGVLSATDPNEGDTVSFSLVPDAADNDRFQIGADALRASIA